MSGVKVVTDSSCDLPPELASSQDIRVVPLTIRFGPDEFVDRRDLTPAEFWSRCSTSPALPVTAAPSPGAFEEAFRVAIADGAEGIAAVCLSSKLSATIQAAQLGAQAAAGSVPIRVIDSLSVSLGLGLLVLKAAELAVAGKGLDDVAGGVEDLIPRSRLFAALDTLENLRKGGRIGGAQAFIGGMLSVKPIISVVDGQVEPASRQRTRSRALRYLIDRVASDRGAIERLGVVHAQAADVGEFCDQLATATSIPRDQQVVGDVGAVIGTHAGPGAVGVMYTVAG